MSLCKGFEGRKMLGNAGAAYSSFTVLRYPASTDCSLLMFPASIVHDAFPHTAQLATVLLIHYFRFQCSS